MFRSGGKPLEDAMHNKSSTAKFISRSQPRTYASASSVNVSTGQLQYPNGNANKFVRLNHFDLFVSLYLSIGLMCSGSDNRLSENEAVEEIKQLAKQLQNLYERIPQRGPTTNVILTLLDICRTAQASTAGALTLKPPTQPHEQAKKLSICNGSSCGSGVDKETNTSLENLAWQQPNGRLMISDKCDNDNHLTSTNSRSKCCDASKKAAAMNCSTNSINFENLQLQCMCSSDNNSLEEYQIENCDNGTSTMSPCKHHRVDSYQSESFRERLLNFTSCNSRQDDQQRGSNLRKRNSELVLGTNFEATPMSVGVYKSCQSYRISCDNIFSDKPAMTSASGNNKSISTRDKSNYSLSNELDQTSQIPYSFLERPTMKYSQSEDQNLRELKIALSSTLDSANKVNNSDANTKQLIGSLKSSHVVTQHSQSYTSSSSTSSKADKISFSLSTSSTSEIPFTGAKKLRPQQNVMTADARVRADDSEKHDVEGEKEARGDEESCGNQPDNEMITAATKPADDDKNSSPTLNANNPNINNGNNSNGKKRKTQPEGKMSIDFNDRSKYTEEVSV